MRHKHAPGWFAAALTLGLVLPDSARAQVGHDPARSPYRTLRFGQFIGLSGGLLNGEGGQLGVAPHHGGALTLRYDFLSASTVGLSFGFTLANTERNVINPTKPIESAVSGPVRQRTGMAEVALQFNLTGGKTWHRLAPYLSGAIGAIVGEQTPSDSSAYKFRLHFVATPSVGVRVFLTDRMFLRLEARSAFWSVSYPASFRTAPSSDPSKPPVLASPAKEWLANGWYTVGLAYAFSRPF